MIKAIIVEDENPARETLNSYLERYFPNVQVEAETDSVKETITLLNTEQFDVMFLDIQLTDGFGIEVLQKVKYLLPRVIITTAYDNYTQEAFYHKAFGYLLKPLDPEDFKDIMNRVVKDIIFKDQSSSYIKIPNKSGHISLNISEIVRCEAMSNYTKLFTFKGDQYILSKTLKSMEENILPKDQFLRIHQSHMVSIKYIDKHNVSSKFISILNGGRVPVSRTRRDQIKKRLLQLGIDLN